jgi:hypothetical protein
MNFWPIRHITIPSAVYTSASVKHYEFKIFSLDLERKFVSAASVGFELIEAESKSRAKSIALAAHVSGVGGQ